MIDKYKMFFRKKPILSAASTVVLAVSGGLCADSPVLNIDIKQQKAGIALLELAEKSGVQILVPKNIGRDVQLPALHGEYTLGQALETLLENTGLRYEFSSDNLVVVKGVTAENRKSKDKSSSSEIEEMVVTATKRAESIQDIPVSITAMGAEEMERRSLVSAGDYLISVPGVSYTDRGVGFNQIVVRGVGASTLGTGDSSVGSYFGEAPLVNVGGDWSNPEVILVDMERVEVLKGPQGTLFGSGALGGVVRNIPTAPNLQEIEGEINAGYSYTGKNGSDNNKISAVINVPIIQDVLAFRTVIYNHENSGYVNLIGANDPAKVAAAESFGLEIGNASGIGGNEYKGMRTSVLWQPSENLDITLMYLNQDLDQDGFYVEIGADTNEYETDTYKVNNSDILNDVLADDLDLTSLVVEYDLGWANVLSSSTYFERSVGAEVSGVYYFFFNEPLFENSNDNKSDGFTQEVRLTSELDGRVQFMAGVYYEDVKRRRNTTIDWAVDPALMPAYYGDTAPNDIYNDLDETTIKQKALFGEVSYDITEQIELSYGLRWFDYTRTTNQITSGIWLGENAVNESSSESDVIHRINVNYTPNDDVLLYLQWSQGFRLGRPQRRVSAATCDLNNDGLIDGTSGSVNQGDISSDYSDSYELGAKFSLLDGRLRVSTAVFRSDWDDIPVGINNGVWGCGITTNAGKALTQGAEIESVYYVTNALQISLGASYTDAELAEDNEALGQPKGTRLPSSARVNGRLGIQQEFELAGKEAFIRADYSYLSDFRTSFNTTGLISGDYGTLGMRAGIQFDDLSVAIFGNNLTDESAFSQGFDQIFKGYRIRPRTIGVEAKYRF